MTRFFIGQDGIPEAKIHIEFFGVKGIERKFDGFIVRSDRTDPDRSYADVLEKEFGKCRCVFDGDINVLDNPFASPSKKRRELGCYAKPVIHAHSLRIKIGVEALFAEESSDDRILCVDSL